MNTTEYETNKRKVKRFEELNEQLSDLERTLNQLECGGDQFTSLGILYGGCHELLLPAPGAKTVPDMLPKKYPTIRLSSSLTDGVRLAVRHALRAQIDLIKAELKDL